MTGHGTIQDSVAMYAVARGGYAILLNATNYQGLGTNRNTTKRERMDEAEGRRGLACDVRSSCGLQVRGFPLSGVPHPSPRDSLILRTINLNNPNIPRMKEEHA